jgi:hypothetical protein
VYFSPFDAVSLTKRPSGKVTLESTKLPNQLVIVVTILLGIQSIALASGDMPAMKFRTTNQVAPKLLHDLCGNTFYKVRVLKNAKNEIGGFVLQSSIMDSPIPFLDCDGKPLTAFHIFAPDAEKVAALKIINPLKEQFPIDEPLDCTTANASK